MAGLLVGGFIVLGTTLSGLIRFFTGGDMSEFFCKTDFQNFIK